MSACVQRLRRLTRRGACAGWSFLVLLPALVSAEQLPIKSYTTTDGLVQNNVIRVVRDSRGFLWLCTRDGLSRFDGYRFRNYGMSDGLPHPSITFLLEARDGTYWAATNGGGVARLNTAAGPAGRRAPLFSALPVGDSAPTNRVNVLFEDRSGQIWAGTDGELFRLERSNGSEVFRKVDFGLTTSHPWFVVLGLAEDRQGRLWIATDDGLLVRSPTGRVARFSIRPAGTYDYVKAVITDSQGRIWIGHDAGVIVIATDTLRTLDALADGQAHGLRTLGAGLQHWFTSADGLSDDDAQSLCESADGHFWVGTTRGLNEYDGVRFRHYTAAQGMALGPLVSVVEDGSGNIWAATSRGAARIARNGFTTFRAPEGLAAARVHAILEDRAGQLYVVTKDATIHAFDGKRFVGIRPQLPRGLELESPQAPVKDQAGQWWIPTLLGLFRFRAVGRFADLAQAAPQAVYTEHNGLPSGVVLAAYEDAHGALWLSLGGGRDRVTRRERSTGRLTTYTEADGVPAFLPPSAFAEDGSGALWLGRSDGGVLRQREGRFELLASHGVPTGPVNQLFVDRAGRLWIATNGTGVAWLEAPGAAEPRVRTMTQADGLASNDVTCVAEGEAGRVYLGTRRGVDELDPANGRVTHYTTDDGLVDDEVEVAFRDRSGALWFGTPRGLARLTPRGVRTGPPQPVFITRLRIAGQDVPVSELGQAEVTGLELAHTQNQVVVDFAGVSSLIGSALRYQYKLEGAHADWSAPGLERSVDFANLAPGQYRFLVRAVGADGTLGSAPAVVAFGIAPPIWLRWWFIAALLVVIAAVARAAYQYRVAHLLEVANVRARIATDLHDDIGANLTRIAILSEVALQQRAPESEIAEGQLSSIARISRESVAAMSDIVWAINPHRDRLLDLVRRMRQHAEELFTTRGTAVAFQAPADGEDVKLAVDVKRDLFLIFKEAASNAARHARCTRVMIEFGVEASGLRLVLSDDGRGFDPAGQSEGQGLGSMRRRAEGRGGSFAIEARAGGGTTVRVTIPLAGSRRGSLPHKVGDGARFWE